MALFGTPSDGKDGIIAPATYHHVTVVGPVAFRVAFLRVP